jgi:hypothetical protein
MSVEFLDGHCILENQKLKVSSPKGHIVSAFDFVYLLEDSWYVQMLCCCRGELEAFLFLQDARHIAS